MNELKLYRQEKDCCVPTSLVFLANNFLNCDLDLSQTCKIARNKYFGKKKKIYGFEGSGMNLFKTPFLLEDIKPNLGLYVSAFLDKEKYLSRSRKNLEDLTARFGERTKIEAIDNGRFFMDEPGYCLIPNLPMIVGINFEESLIDHAVVGIESDGEKIKYFDPDTGKVDEMKLGTFLHYMGDTGGIDMVNISLNMVGLTSKVN